MRGCGGVVRSLVLAGLLGAAGCGYGLHQTAKTQRPGTVSLQTGISYVSNEVISAQPEGVGPFVSLGGDVGPLRVGLSDHMDMGLGFFYVNGLRLDSKLNVMPREDRLAIAPRIGAGFASNEGRSTAMWMGGVIGSYDVWPTFFIPERDVGESLDHGATARGGSGARGETRSGDRPGRWVAAARRRGAVARGKRGRAVGRVRALAADAERSRDELCVRRERRGVGGHAVLLFGRL